MFSRFTVPEETGVNVRINWIVYVDETSFSVPIRWSEYMLEDRKIKTRALPVSKSFVK